MLTQFYRREIPELGLFFERTMLRDPGFCVALIRARGIALDRGVLHGALRFVGRLRRPQLTILLAGHGYIQVGGRVTSLCAGDVVESDQRLHEGEGYGGSPCEVVIVDAEPGGYFDAPGAACRTSRIGAADVGELSGLVGSFGATPPRRWIAELSDRLRALGHGLASNDARDIAPSPAPLVQLYGALGAVLSRLDDHPSLDELATTLGIGERHAKRRLAALSRGYGHSFDSWRDFVHEMRLDWATQLLSAPNLSLERVASLAGYRSTVALHHAFSMRGADTPRAISRVLARRWR